MLFTLVYAGKYRTEDKLKNRHTTKTKDNSDKANNAKYSRTKLAWFSRLIRHSARKRGGLILQCSSAHMWPVMSHTANTFVCCVWRDCSATTMMSTTMAQSVSSVCLSHVTPSYCRAVTSACVTAAPTISATRPTTARYAAPSSTRCCKFVPCVTRPPLSILLLVVLAFRPPRSPADLWYVNQLKSLETCLLLE